MSRETPRELALRRMLDADDAKNDAGNANDPWAVWQRAATDYWLLVHPELRRLRRRDGAVLPTVSEMRERADHINRAMDGIPDNWRLRPPSADKIEHLARVGWYHELMAGLYDPIASALPKVGDDPSAIEVLTRFLEADVYCHRSGYTKSDVIRALAKATPSDAKTRRRLQGVVVAVVDGPDRREFRDYVRLARAVDDATMQTRLRGRLHAGAPVVARHARWILEGLGVLS
jgi:hypothetical protein